MLNILSIGYIELFLTEDLKIHPILFIHKRNLEYPETLKPICFNTWAHSLKQSFQITSRICLTKKVFFLLNKAFFLKVNFFLSLELSQWSWNVNEGFMIYTWINKEGITQDAQFNLNSVNCQYKILQLSGFDAPLYTLLCVWGKKQLNNRSHSSYSCHNLNLLWFFSSEYFLIFQHSP